MIRIVRNRNMKIELVVLVIASMFVLWMIVRLHGRRNNVLYLYLDNTTSTGSYIRGDSYSRDETYTKLPTVRMCTQEMRKEHIAKLCQRYKTETKHNPNFIIDPEKKLAYCHIGKTGSTTMKTLLDFYSNESKKFHWKQPYTTVYSTEIESYTKFLVVRNPYQRIVSAFNDKLKGNHHDVRFQTLKKNIFQFLQKTNEDEELEFHEFISYLQNNKEVLRADGHFASSVYICDPCNIKYDFILRTESLLKDVEPLLPLVKKTYLDFFSSTKNVGDDKQKSELFNLRFSQYLHEFSKLTKEQIDYLKSEYYYDDVIFGYGLDENGTTSFCKIETATNNVCC